MTHTDALHVPYKGGDAAMPDLLSGRVQFMFCNLPICLPHIRAGKLIALGVTSAKRSSLLPQVPTMAEAGLPGCGVDGWFGLFAPSAVPERIRTRLNVESVRILKSDSVRQSLLAQGAEPVANSQEAFGAFVRAEHNKWAEVVKTLNIQLD
jgi:tripartite-type tricarboxylate transporter receptor subunit TctC